VHVIDEREPTGLALSAGPTETESALDRMIRWMDEHRIITVVLAGLYFVAVVTLHEEVSKVSVWLSMRLSLRLYDKTISAFGAVLAVVLSPPILSRIWHDERRAAKIFYWCLTVGLVAASYNVLFVVNAESIHFPQYAILALPVFALTRSFGVTILTVTLLGAIDEANQFFVLKNWTYFDFNDVITNLAGGAIGVLLIFTFSRHRSATRCRPITRLLRSAAFLVTAGLVAAGFALYLLGLLALYPGPHAEGAWIVLSKVPPSATFWIRMTWGRTYHILTPIEGLALWAVLSGCYAFMDRADPSASTVSRRA
jgi:VanZ family protein